VLEFDQLDGKGDNIKKTLSKYVVGELVQKLSNCPDEVFAASEQRGTLQNMAFHKPPWREVLSQG
jgi:hypothetical protein